MGSISTPEQHVMIEDMIELIEGEPRSPACAERVRALIASPDLLAKVTKQRHHPELSLSVAIIDGWVDEDWVPPWVDEDVPAPQVTVDQGGRLVARDQLREAHKETL